MWRSSLELSVWLAVVDALRLKLSVWLAVVNALGFKLPIRCAVIHALLLELAIGCPVINTPSLLLRSLGLDSCRLLLRLLAGFAFLLASCLALSGGLFSPTCTSAAL